MPIFNERFSKYLQNSFEIIKTCEHEGDFYMVILNKHFISGILLEISNEFTIKRIISMNFEVEIIISDGSFIKREFKETFIKALYDYIISYNFDAC